MSSKTVESRGRDVISTGRGGAGNAVRSPSRSKASFLSDPSGPPLAPGSERGRTVGKESVVEKIFHTGRGGAGNTRSPSKQGRADDKREEVLEERLVAERRGRDLLADAPTSSGRGGVGNINTSRSRSRSRQSSMQTGAASGLQGLLHHHKGSATTKDHDLSKTTTRSSATFVAGGRGGYGNIIPADHMTPEQRAQLEADKLEDAQLLQRWRSGRPQEAHSSGRGGTGNLAPPLETETEAALAAMSLTEREARDRVDLESARLGRTTGHGGIGNYVPPAAGTELDEDRGRGGERPGVMRKVLRSLSRQSAPREQSAGREERS